MRVLLLDQFSEPGGAQQCLLETLPALRARGWDALVGMPPHGPLCDRINQLGVDVVPITCGRYRSGSKSGADVARFAAELPRLTGEIRACAGRFRPDLLYLNGPRLLPAALWAGLPIPTLFHSHSHLGQGASRRLAGAAVRRLRAWVVCVCRLVAEQWSGYAESGRLRVIYNGVNGPRQLRPRKAGPPVVGCVGRIAPEKGQREFVEAARAISRSVPDCWFSIVGGPLFGDDAAHRYAAEVRAAAAGLPVTFTGWVEDVYAALADLDLVLVPAAAHEATTRVILEAWAAGVPVVALGRGGIPEIVTDRQNGYLCRSVEEMGAVAAGVLTGEIPGLAMVAAGGHQCWRRNFTLERSQSQLLELMEGIVAGSTARGAQFPPPVGARTGEA